MAKFYTLLAATAMMSSVSMFADNTATITVSPDPAKTYETLPTEFVITFDGPTSVEAKSKWGGNPAKITKPDGTAQQLTATYAENKMTLKTPSAVDVTVEGDYTLELLNDKVKMTWADETTTTNTAQSWTIKVGAAAEESGISISPDPKETYETLPTEFTVTFNGAKELKKKGPIVNNTIKVTGPDGNSQVITPTTSGNKLVAKLPAKPNTDITKAGEFTISLVGEKYTVTWDDDTQTANEAKEWKYTVTGSGEPEDDSVKYDLTITSFTPKLAEFNVSEKTLETLQMVVPMADVKPTEDATVTISGPGYYASAQIVFSMGNTQATWLKAKFSDPKYNGKYTLSIPKGSFGTAAWFEDPEKGHANDAIEYEFEVIGGAEYVDTGVETNLAMSFNPSMGKKVAEFDKVTVTFAEKVFYNEEETVNAGVMRDFAAMGYSAYGTATFTRISDTELEVVFENPTDTKGQYCITIPEGYFWNEAHENDAQAGKVNAEIQPYWIYMPVTPTVEVLSTTPAEGAKLSHFPVDYEVVINTDDNESVSYMTLSMTETLSDEDSDMSAPKSILSDIKSESKNADGAICWKNTEELFFKKGYYYELTYALFNDKDQELATGIITFDGDDYVGVSEVELNGNGEVVYTLQGIRVNRSLNEVPAGIYIVNGKKVIRK